MMLLSSAWTLCRQFYSVANAPSSAAALTLLIDFLSPQEECECRDEQGYSSKEGQ